MIQPRDVEKAIRDVNVRMQPVADRKVLADTLAAQERSAPAGSLGTMLLGIVPWSAAARWAVTAAVLVTVGFVAGRASRPGPVDVEQLAATLEGPLRVSIAAKVREDLTAEMDGRFQAMAARDKGVDSQALHQAILADAAALTGRAVATSEARTNKRLLDMATQIEAARAQERRYVASAIDQIEARRLAEQARLGEGLIRLAMCAEGSN